jgi:hypothetical protein
MARADEQVRLVEALRATLVAWFARLPEPPVYRRHDDPVRAQAKALRGEAQTLLASVEALEGQPGLSPWRAALEAWAGYLELLQEGRVEAAELAWAQAVALERVATQQRRSFARSDEARLPVFDRQSGTSRYDERPAATVASKLVCPGCRSVSEHTLSSSRAQHPMRCPKCGRAFSAWVGEVEHVEVRPVGKRRHYAFKLLGLGGEATRLEVDEFSGADFPIARRDLLAFLYEPEQTLRGVLNLSSSRVLWVSPGGACFVATVAFGEGAWELTALRLLRDELLLPRPAGRLFVRSYYRAGPALAQVVVRFPRLRSLTRRALTAVAQGFVAVRRRGP